ncbi:MAG TPA: RHS repeat-associated core domain-containing protein, partial [Lachnospiraceae bacterium]|nr:RHS repeat-associated core domain-containing protein [Lachnospiraceae bacterium]
GHPFDSPDTEISPSNYIPYNRTIYGKPTEEVLNSCGVAINTTLLDYIFDNMKNTRDKNVGATVAYDASGNATVVKMAGYNRLGRKEMQWVVFMTQGMPAIQLSYEYNQSDELTHSRFEEWNGSVFVAKAERYRSYDSKGRLIKIEDENHQNIAAYEYTPNGNVKRKSYYDKGVLVYDKVIIRDVQGRPTEIRYEKNGVVLYTDKLNYETPLAGRLSEAERSWKNIPSKGNQKRTGKYSYDDDGRLTKVEAPLSGEYRYDELNGQMSYKKEGDSVIAMSYSIDKYRPKGFDINGRSPSGTAEYFKYDDAGNVWYDRHAKTSYKLNAAGLPEVAYIQNEYHADLTLSAVNGGVVEDIKDIMYMNYDESGQRIWTRIKTKDGDYAEFTLSGVGVYSADIGAQTGDAETVYTLKRMDLVAGGYRDGVNGKAYFPVTDAQGNVRGYASDEGLVSAYDYYAYGGVEDIVVNETDDKKRWQGKEYDGEHGKYYFGARYFDPFFGMWLSPDPAAQFANPYTYGGDPINGKDYNGLWFGIDDAIAAGVGAVVGFATYSITHYDDWDWKQAMVYTGIGAGAGWLTWNTGGATLATAAGKTGGLAANLTLAQTMGYGAVSSGVGAGFTSAATYTEKAAYGNNGYSIQNLEDNWNAKDFATATLTGAVVGAGIGAGMAGASWGISYYSNLASQKFYETPDEKLSEADQFVKKNRLRRSPVDKGWESAGIKRDDNLVSDVLTGKVDRGSEYANFVAKKGFCGDGLCQRFEGGLHVDIPDIGNAVGHYDYFDPSEGMLQTLGHIFIEVPLGKTILGSSVSFLEPSLVVPLINGFIFDWEKTEWFW